MTATFRRFWDSTTTACAYLLTDTGGRDAVLIDPVRDQVPLYLAVLDELDLRLGYVLETHLHADHITGAHRLRTLTGAAIACPAGSGITGADIDLRAGDALPLGELSLQALPCPGHTAVALAYRTENRLFSGDSLLIGGCGRTDEPGASPGQLYDSIVRHLLTLPDETLLFPGHGSQLRWVSCIGEEKRANPMFSGVSRDEFIALCGRRPPGVPPANDILTANRQCGAPH